MCQISFKQTCEILSRLSRINFGQTEKTMKRYVTTTEAYRIFNVISHPPNLMVDDQFPLDMAIH